MRLLWTLRSGIDSTDRLDVLIEAPAGTPLANVLPLLRAAFPTWPTGAATARTAAVARVAGRIVTGEHPLGSTPLLDGALVDPLEPKARNVSMAGAESAAPAVPDGGRRGADTVPEAGEPWRLELHVVSGPRAGAVHPLPSGAYLLGSGPDCPIRLVDPAVAARHARLVVTGERAHISDLRSPGGVWAEGARVGARGRELSVGTRLAIGASVLVLRARDTRRASRTATGKGTYAVNRRPRHRPPNIAAVFTLPEEPQRPPAPAMNLLTLVLPLLVSVLVAVALRNALFLLFGLLSPALTFSQWAGERRTRRRDHADDVAEHARDVRRTQRRLAAAAERELARRRTACPDPARTLAVASDRLEALWERRPEDADHLTVRLGTGRIPAEAGIRSPDGEMRHPDLDEAPVELDLAGEGCVGLCGDREPVLGLVRSLLGQSLTWAAPVDVRLAVLLAGPVRALDWRWAGPLPHLRGRDGLPRVVVAQNTDDEPSARPGGRSDADGTENTAGRPDTANPANPAATADADGDHAAASDDPAAGLVAELAAEVDARRADPQRGGPRLLLVLDGARSLRDIPGLPDVLAAGPGVGVHAVCLESCAAALPVECGTAVHVGACGRAELTRTGRARLRLRADLVEPGWAEQIARALAPCRELAPPERAEAGLPEDVSLADLLDLDPMCAETVARRWRRHPRTTRVPIGVGLHGPHRLDLQVHGPHLLVGGMTGSGKSEFLRTLLCSLAVANRPDELGVVLIDYKGGTAFADCAELPHVLGLVTDLDDALTARVLVSLRAELRRREGALRRAGVATVEAYREQRGRDATLAPLPRLLVVLDEFRALQEECPDFVHGLVRVATQGRALGVHLVLATQRPAGVVSPEIKANTNLRVALRMRDDADSIDVIDTPDAARPTATVRGRALLRTGGGRLVPVQVARAGARRRATGPPIRLVVLDPSGERCRVPDPSGGATTSPTEGAGMGAIVAALTKAARLTGCVPVTPPWVPALPEVLDATALTGRAARRGELAYGLLDDPAHQSRRTAVWSWIEGDHLALVGGPRSGRTTALRTLAGLLAATACPGALHLYVLDGGGGLADLAALPHTGAVVGPDEPARLRRVLVHLRETVRRRERAPADPSAPALLVLADDWERLRDASEALPGASSGGTEEWRDLLRTDRSVGLRAVLTGGRGLLAGDVAAHLREKLLLPLADPTDALLAGLSSAEATSRRPGRGRRMSDRLEIQLGVLGEDPSLAAQRARLEAVAARAAAAHTDCGPRPRRLEPLPRVVHAEELASGREPTGPLDPSADASVDSVVIGRGSGADAVARVRLTPGLLVAGPRGSGRTSTLRTLAAGALGLGRRCLILGPHLDTARWADSVGADHVFDAFDPTARERLSALLGPPGPARTATECDGRRPGEGPPVLFVDDVELLAGSTIEDDLTRAVRRRDRGATVVVAAGESGALTGLFRGPVPDLRRLGRGVVLGPTPADRDLWGRSLSLGEALVPGRGVLLDGRREIAVQVALPPRAVG